MKDFWEKQLAEVINKQFEINWYDVTYSDIVANHTIELEPWYKYYTTTMKYEKQFRERLLNYMKPYVLEWRSQKEAAMFLLSYWLRVTDFE